ncbi:hypothetical protein [Lysobacter sp. CA196]|uniref:hypothetical protein n=1 Tax=Lysobacter sp. CA196 TaxID=3455606 RepID=UPI003F8D41B0
MPSFVRLCLSLSLTALWAVATLYPGAASAQIRRCTDTHGNSVYTDRDCASVGGVDRLPRGAAAQQKQQQAYVGGCARNLRDLVGLITSAIDAHDGNRLASAYHWAGMSGDQGYAVLQRLDAIAQRPLLDIAPILSSPAPPPPEPSGGAWTTLPPAAPNAATAPLPPIPPPATPLGSPAGAATAEAPDDANEGTTAAPPPAAPVAHRRTPVALRLEQTMANGVTPSRTVFGLYRHFGCWWIRGG